MTWEEICSKACDSSTKEANGAWNECIGSREVWEEFCSCTRAFLSLLPTPVTSGPWRLGDCPQGVGVQRGNCSKRWNWPDFRKGDSPCMSRGAFWFTQGIFESNAITTIQDKRVQCFQWFAAQSYPGPASSMQWHWCGPRCMLWASQGPWCNGEVSKGIFYLSTPMGQLMAP